jgi:REP element-mobilizing transposase RayT
MQQLPYRLDSDRQRVVLGSMQQVCSHREWTLLAAHVRTNHVHVVVAADKSPEQVMNALKAYASRALNGAALDRPDRRRWARHGSTRHLWTIEAVSAAVHYIVCEQGEPMAVFQRSSAR